MTKQLLLAPFKNTARRTNVNKICEVCLQTIDSIQNWLLKNGVQNWRCNQMFEWKYNHRIDRIFQISNVFINYFRIVNNSNHKLEISNTFL